MFLIGSLEKKIFQIKFCLLKVTKAWLYVYFEMKDMGGTTNILSTLEYFVTYYKEMIQSGFLHCYKRDIYKGNSLVI